jgi:hypothetical protein
MAAWYWSFVKDAAVIKAQGYADAVYSWELFLCGAVCCAAGFSLALMKRRKEHAAV